MNKSIALDIHAKSSLGESLNIEIQLGNHRGFMERILFYWSRQYGSQLQSGEDYQCLQRTVSIFLLNFDLTKQDAMHSVYQVLETERYEMLSDKLEIHLLELPKLTLDHREREQTLGNWLQFLRGATKEDWERLSTDDDELRKVMSTQKNRELAIGMLNEGVPVEIITMLTGYSVEDLVLMKDQK